MHIPRYLEGAISTWLDERMVFLGGPRQVGKTYLAKKFLDSREGYLSWDDLADRENLRKHRLPGAPQLLVLDELHKYARWRMLLKGLYDKKGSSQKIIVTGSARLDQFRKGGDSLFGRYHYLRLHPLSIPEAATSVEGDVLERLLTFGGFPEPFLKQSESFAKIWRRERIARVIQQDLRDLTNLKDYSQLELLADLLPSRVGSLLSIKSLAEDLEKSPHTIVNWIEILASVYNCFLIAPYGPAKVKAIKKQRKIYMWDWSSIEKAGPRFENFVASHLLKYCHHIEDTEGDAMELRFLRDQFGRELDFVVLKNKKPVFAVECKTGEGRVSPHFEYFRSRTHIPKFYQVHVGKEDYLENGIHVVPFAKFCRMEGLP